MKRLYSNDISLQFGDYNKLYKEYCGDNEIDYNPDNVYKWLIDMVANEYDNFVEFVQERQEPLRVLVTGTFMCWNGPRNGGKIYDSLDAALLKTPLDNSTFSVYSDDKNNLCLDEWHHDSPIIPNHYEFRYITDIGERWLEVNGESHTPECHEGLRVHRRSKKIILTNSK